MQGFHAEIGKFHRFKSLACGYKEVMGPVRSALRKVHRKQTDIKLWRCPLKSRCGFACIIAKWIEGKM